MSSVTAGDVAPFKVGFLDEGLSDDDAEFDRGFGSVLRMRFAEALENNELDRPVELVVARGAGLPRGTAQAVQQAWTQLADQGCLIILGPGITDNCLAVRSLHEARGIPTIGFPGTSGMRGEYGFQYQLGSLTDDSTLIARAIAGQGRHTVAIIRDSSPIGETYFQAFAEEAARTGLEIVADSKCSPNEVSLERFVAKSRAPKPDALAYLGFGAVLLTLSRDLTAAEWDPPRFTTTAGMHFYSKTNDEREAMSGWVYVDQVDEQNSVLSDLLDRYEKAYGTRPFSPITGCAYDMATLAVYGLRKATVYTPEGVKEGLERIQLVPSALGAAGTVQGFGPWERSALKGADYLLLRQMQGTSTVRYA